MRLLKQFGHKDNLLSIVLSAPACYIKLAYIHTHILLDLLVYFFQHVRLGKEWTCQECPHCQEVASEYRSVKWSHLSWVCLRCEREEVTPTQLVLVLIHQVAGSGQLCSLV